MSEKTEQKNTYKIRFACGEISRCTIATPRKIQGKQGEFDSYSLLIKGAFEDTKEPVDGWFNSTQPVKVYEGDEEPINPAVTNGLRFKGRIMFSECEQTGRQYLKAVSIEERLGEEPAISTGNPFNANPLV